MVQTKEKFNINMIQALLNRGSNSLEWILTSPAKPHAFVSLPLQSDFWGVITLAECFDIADEIRYDFYLVHQILHAFQATSRMPSPDLVQTFSTIYVEYCDIQEFRPQSTLLQQVRHYQWHLHFQQA